MSTVVSRQRLGKVDPAQLARDIDRAFDDVVPTRLVKLTDIYAEPLVVAFDHEPSGGVLLTRLQEDASPETATNVYAVMPFRFTSRGVEVSEIYGATLGTRYRYTFLMVG